MNKLPVMKKPLRPLTIGAFCCTLPLLFALQGCAVVAVASTAVSVTAGAVGAATGWACRVLSSRVTLARRLISSSTKNTVPYTVLGVPQRPQAVGVLTGVCVSSLTKPHLLQR